MVLLLWRNLVKEKEGAWRRRIYRKYASCKWLKDTGLEFTRADVVVSISRGPPGQWFPETEYWASAIFVGTSGIPPKIIYRAVKSYMPPPQIDKYWKYFSICSLTWRQNLRDCWLCGGEWMQVYIFLAWELVRTFFGIPCGHKVKFWCRFMCRTASTQCLTQFAVIMSYISCVRLLLGCVDIWSCGNCLLFEHSMKVVLCAVEWSDRWISFLVETIIHCWI